jgi:hypothetical protein
MVGPVFAPAGQPERSQVLEGLWGAHSKSNGFKKTSPSRRDGRKTGTPGPGEGEEVRALPPGRPGVACGPPFPRVPTGRARIY